LRNRFKSIRIDEILLIALTGFLAFSIMTRVFSFFTLPHLIKAIVLLYLVLVLGLLIFRFVRPSILAQFQDRKAFLTAISIAAVLTLTLFLLIDYRMVPIRTTHTLQITNPSDSSRVAIYEIHMPGDELLSFSESFPQQRIEDDHLILAPGETLSYSREMVGGIQFDAEASGLPARIVVTWDGVAREYSFDGENIVIDVKLDGSSWGVPSLPYRILGLVSILSDWVVIFGGSLILTLLLWPWKNRVRSSNANAFRIEFLDHLSLSIILNSIIVVLGGLYAFFFNGQTNILLLLFLTGVLLYLRDLVKFKRQWIYVLTIGLLTIGIMVNGYFWIYPPHDLHQTIINRPYNSFAYLADRIGASNATYLSIGYYQYLREAHLIIPESLYEELQLSEGRLQALNQLRDFTFRDYDHELTDDQVVSLFYEGEWEVWPNRTGGEYYLLPDISRPGDTYYFFSHGLKYFLVPQAYIQESGVIDVSISD